MSHPSVECANVQLNSSIQVSGSDRMKQAAKCILRVDRLGQLDMNVGWHAVVPKHGVTEEPGM